MTGATKAQLPKNAIGTMTFEEINPLPALEMERTIC
jgi:hypothetical protein